MEVSKLPQKIIEFIKKYRYAALILLLGILLMIIPVSSRESANDTPAEVQTQSEIPFRQQLSDVLSQIAGVGRVEVFLTAATGEETVYMTNEDITVKDDTSTTQRDTVTVTDAEHNQIGLIRQVNPPKYLGVIVVCQGAESPAVRLAVTDAVSKVTGLGSDRISVLKMK